MKNLVLILFLIHGTGLIAQNIKIEFIGEQLIPNESIVNGREVGGLSSIDYYKGRWIAICDSSKDASRAYELELCFEQGQFESVKVLDEIVFKDKDGVALNPELYDPEGLRVVNDSHMIWASEGFLQRGSSPEVVLADFSGKTISSLQIPKVYSNENIVHNGTFESLALDADSKGFWFANELPLISDGMAPTFDDNTSAFVRFNFYSDAEEKVVAQYAYQLDKVALPSSSEKGISLNGLVEILNIDETQFLCLERSYTSGYDSKGNNVKLYLGSVNDYTTQVLGLKSLQKGSFVPMKKQLILDFDAFQDQFPSKRIDNIEGVCFGPVINGKKTLVFISDNNFNIYDSQVTQILVFAISGV